MNEFENKIINHLKDRGVSEPTIKLYLFQLRQINNGKINDLKKFENINYVLDFLKGFKINTQRTKLISIIAMLKTFPEYKDLQNQYSEIVANINKETNKTSNEKTEKQKENWMNKQDIIDIWDSLQNVVKTFTTKKNLSEKQYNILLQFMILSLYTLINPRRNSDFMKMIVVKKNEKDLSTDYNYLDLQKRKFIFNQYKTKKTYSQQIEDIPENLWNVIKLYLKFKPTDTNYFLCNFDGQPLPHVNSITLILNKIFGRLAK